MKIKLIEKLQTKINSIKINSNLNTLYTKRTIEMKRSSLMRTDMHWMDFFIAKKNK